MSATCCYCCCCYYNIAKLLSLPSSLSILITRFTETSFNVNCPITLGFTHQSDPQSLRHAYYYTDNSREKRPYLQDVFNL
uniref:Uncharacterized protein n=1 Tax=Octopus bimaculoides TaxID=37653 RepID=A0A0L8GQR6_OCTBM